MKWKLIRWTQKWKSDLCDGHIWLEEVLAHVEVLVQIWCGGRGQWAKAEHSGILMKRDSEVCWSGMSLSLLQDPSEQRGRAGAPVIECGCWPIVKLQLNSFSIIITICFPYRLEIGAEAFRHRSAGRGSGRTFLFALTPCGSLVLWVLWWPSHHDFTS